MKKDVAKLSFIAKVPEAFQKLIDSAEATLKDTIEREEKVPIDQVTNFDEVSVIMFN